jgi:hypothetical protein
MSWSPERAAAQQKKPAQKSTVPSSSALAVEKALRTKSRPVVLCCDPEPLLRLDFDSAGRDLEDRADSIPGESPEPRRRRGRSPRGSQRSAWM